MADKEYAPLLTSLTYKAYSEDENEEILYTLSLIIECFHKASLIHDDIEDDTNSRYDTDTVHKKYGIPQAINTGDFLIGKGYELLSKLPVAGTVIAKALLKVSQSHTQLTRGQGADIQFNSGEYLPGVDETLDIFQHKTGEAIKVALILGAILGGANEKEIKTLERFADSLGISYQVRDDLNEFAQEREDEKIADFPLLVALLKEHSADYSLTDVVGFKAKITELELDKKARAILNRYVASCYAELDNLENDRLRLSLYGVLGKIFKPLVTDE